MVTIYLSLAVCLIGLLMFLLSNPQEHPKVQAIGREMFWCGMLAFLLAGGPLFK